MGEVRTKKEAAGTRECETTREQNADRGCRRRYLNSVRHER